MLSRATASLVPIVDVGVDHSHGRFHGRPWNVWARSQSGTICPRPATPGFWDNLSRFQPPGITHHPRPKGVWDNLSQTTSSSPGRPSGASGGELLRPSGTFCLSASVPRYFSDTRGHQPRTICLALAEPRHVGVPNTAHRHESTPTTTPIVPCPARQGVGRSGFSLAWSQQAVVPWRSPCNPTLGALSFDRLTADREWKPEGPEKRQDRLGVGMSGPLR
jgi:hypothetical protein